MIIAENNPPHSLGLGGDGDEIAAVRDVENYFGVLLDYSDAHEWTTVGDVFAALQRELPLDQATAEGTWARFVKATSLETGVNFEQITRSTLLLGQHRFDRRLLLLIAGVAGIAFAVYQNW